MKRFWIWLKTEYKRAAFLLPSLCGRAALVLAAVFLLLFCARRWAEGENSGPIKIGYAAQEDPLTRMAVSYVENMESVKSFCSLVAVDEEEGMERLRRGELTALIVLPRNVVEGILNGQNEPAELYLSQAAQPLGLLFEELADTGIGLLQTAQAEIYATSRLTEEFGEGGETLESMYREIDAFNLNLVMNREQYFRQRGLSPTGSQSVAVYYGGALFTVYLLLSGLFFITRLKRSMEEQMLLALRRGISLPAQLAGRTLVTVFLFFAASCLPAVLWLWPPVRENLRPAPDLPVCGVLFLAFLCAAALLQLVCLLADSPSATILIWGVLALMMGYVSGCFLPSALLPEIVEKLSLFLPTTYIRSAFSMLFSPTAADAGKTAAGLAFFTALFCLTGSLAAETRKRRRAGL